MTHNASGQKGRAAQGELPTRPSQQSQPWWPKQGSFGVLTQGGPGVNTYHGSEKRRQPWL